MSGFLIAQLLIAPCQTTYSLSKNSEVASKKNTILHKATHHLLCLGCLFYVNHMKHISPGNTWIDADIRKLMFQQSRLLFLNKKIEAQKSNHHRHIAKNEHAYFDF